MQILIAGYLHKRILLFMAKWNYSDSYYTSWARGASGRAAAGDKIEQNRPAGSRKKYGYHSPGEVMESKTKLLDQMRHVLRLKHLSIRTEKAYVQWAKRFILFHHKRHPADMGAPEIRDFLIHLAVEGQVAASTQNVALQALLFLYRDVLKQPFPELGDIEHARKSRRVPVVFARQEVTKVLAQLVGIPHLMASLLYGSGLRLMECVRLRVKDVDFAYHQLIVRDGERRARPGDHTATVVRGGAATTACQGEAVTRGRPYCRLWRGLFTLRFCTERPTRRNVVGVAVCFPSLKTIS